MSLNRSEAILVKLTHDEFYANFRDGIIQRLVRWKTQCNGSIRVIVIIGNVEINSRLGAWRKGIHLNTTVMKSRNENEVR